MIQTMCSADFMKGLNFPAEAIEELLRAEKRLDAAESLKPVFAAAEKAFLNKGEGDFQEHLEIIAKESGERRETVDMVFLIRQLPGMLERYRAHGYEEQLFWDTAGDLTCKLMECYQNRGVWGTFVTFWYPDFYRLERFALGRLQFEHRSFPFEGVAGIEKGATVYNCHIPSAGPLTPESVEDSLRRAKAFYAHELNGRPMPVYCSSWLLYPPHVELFAEDSNLRRFAERFTVLDAAPDATNHDFWRIFHRPWAADLPLEALPEDTSLRRAFKRFLMQGNAMGSGKGLLWVD